MINQNRYSILDRSIEKNGLKDAASEEQKGIIVFSPLAQGMLTDRYLNGIPADSRIRTDGRFLTEEQISPKTVEGLRRLDALASERGQSLAQMALNWILKDNVVTSVLVGASKASQLLENIKIVDRTPFTEDELERIDEIVSQMQ